jgi:hypothetical protein
MAVMEQLPNELRDRAAGKTRVMDVRIEPSEDSTGESAIVVRIILSDPPSNAETWPVEDLWELRAVVRDVVAELDPAPQLPWFIAFEPENPGEVDATEAELIDPNG